VVAERAAEFSERLRYCPSGVFAIIKIMILSTNEYNAQKLAAQ